VRHSNKGNLTIMILNKYNLKKIDGMSGFLHFFLGLFTLNYINLNLILIT